MTKEDYILLADQIRLSVELWRESDEMPAVIQMAHGIACALAKDNARFDKARFFVACGLNVTGSI
jgi:hypothetical protein